MIGLYMMWVVGIDVLVIKYMYVNSLILLLIVVIFVLLLNCMKLKFIDWLIVVLVLVIWFLFYFMELICYSIM